MPYIRCPSCGLTTYTPGTPYGRHGCPSCDAELPRRDGRSAPVWGRERERLPGDTRLVRRLLELARTELGMDIAFLGEIRGEREIVHALVGGDAAEVADGIDLPLRDTICGAVLEGRAPNVLPDIAQEPACADLPVPRRAGVQAYIGVPLTGEDARRYVLCCLAREARPDLGARDAQVLHGLAESVRIALDASGSVRAGN